MADEEWKSLFPIGGVFKSPLLISIPSANDSIGPLVFNPLSSSLTRLFSSPSLLPFLSPPPILNLRRFLLTSSPIVPSTSSSVSSLFGEQHCDGPASTLRFNRLQFLRCPNTNWVVVFFPTGPNSDRVGFIVVSGDDSGLGVHADYNDEVFCVEGNNGYLWNPRGNQMRIHMHFHEVSQTKTLKKLNRVGAGAHFPKMRVEKDMLLIQSSFLSSSTRVLERTRTTSETSPGPWGIIISALKANISRVR